MDAVNAFNTEVKFVVFYTSPKSKTRRLTLTNVQWSESVLANLFANFANSNYVKEHKLGLFISGVNVCSVLRGRKHVLIGSVSLYLMSSTTLVTVYVNLGGL